MIDFNMNKMLKARSVFEDFRKDMKTQRDKAGAIQAFEFCYDLSWKLMKRALSIEGVDVNSPKEAFRMAAKNSIISDVEKWFSFQQLRNLIAHTYEFDNAEKIIKSFDSFSQEMNVLISNLEKYVTS